MKRLTPHDIEVIKLAAGYDGSVTLDREDFEALIEGYSGFRQPASVTTMYNDLQDAKRKLQYLETMLPSYVTNGVADER